MPSSLSLNYMVFTPHLSVSIDCCPIIDLREATCHWPIRNYIMNEIQMYNCGGLLHWIMHFVKPFIVTDINNNVKRRNTVGGLDQYTTPISKYTEVECSPPPQMEVNVSHKRKWVPPSLKNMLSIFETQDNLASERIGVSQRRSFYLLWRLFFTLEDEPDIMIFEFLS